MKFEIEEKYSNQTLLQISALLNIWAAKMASVVEPHEIEIEIRTHYMRSSDNLVDKTWEMVRMAMTKVENKGVKLTGELQL
jgi:hypothetical protein